MKYILVMNPGSISTKIAVFEEESPLFCETINHSAEELAPFEHVTEQYEFRKSLVLKCLSEHSFDPARLDAVVARGGILPPISAGAYEINDDMVWQLENRAQNEHASNVGARIALTIAREYGVPAYIYDGITVDELDPINKLTGLKEFRRKGMAHNLNSRAAAMRYARENGRAYDELTVIVAHLGGGISVTLHHKGRIVDCINDEEGSFSPERAGGLPMFDTVRMCCEDGATYDSVMKKIKWNGGLMAHLGTKDCIEIERRIAEGDEHAALVYDAMSMNVAKNIGKLAPYVQGKVDAILLTGGVIYSERVTEYIRRHVEFIAPVIAYPGEDEMKSLALGALRVLRGEESARTFTRTETGWEPV